MRATLSQREYVGWAQYYEAEPWGPWRDNLHAAIIARELRVQNVQPGKRVKLDEFMVPTEKKPNAEQAFFNALKMMAIRKPRQ